MFFKINGLNVPLVTTGTSPFIGAGQFGARAYEYRRKFLRQTEAMLEILEASYREGGRGIEVIPMGKICEAAKIMKQTHDDYVVIGSTFPGPDPFIDDLIELDAKIIFVHASVADRKNNQLRNLLEEISSRGVIPGIAAHNPISTLEFAFESINEIKVFLIPFNASGFIMGNQKKLESLINSQKNCFFVGMKTLAAGKLDPKRAYNYISIHNICSVSIGMVTVQEAEETTKIALESLTNRKPI